MSYSYSTSETFSLTSAKHVASKVVADLRLMQILYGEPSETWIGHYHTELVELLAGRYLASIEYGFKRAGQRLVTLRYVASFDGTLRADENAGKVARGVDVTGASWFSYASYSSEYDRLDSSAKAKLKERLPFQRGYANEPGDGAGVWVAERTYSHNGGGVRRSTFRPY